MKQNILLIYGGPSEEHDVSLRTAAAVAKHLDQYRYNPLLLGITRDKRWFLQEIPEDLESRDVLEIQDFSRQVSIVPGQGLFCENKNLQIDCAFLLVHGTDSEDGKLQGLLEWAGVPYTGSGVLGSAVGMDKSLVKELWRSQGLPVVPWLDITLETWAQNRQDIESHLLEEIGYPLFIKPANSGSSVGVSQAHSPQELEQCLRKAFVIDTKVLAEKLIPCREIECAVLGTENPQAFPPGEIAPKGHEFYDYEAKYIDPDGAVMIIPANLEPTQVQRIQNLAIQAYKVAGLGGYSRMDFFLDKKTGELYLNEVNTLPGFTNISMFPLLAQQTGMNYSQVLDAIIQEGMKSRNPSRTQTT